MKRYCFLLLFLLSLQRGQTQKKIFEFDLADEKLVKPRIGLVINEGKNQFILTLANKNYIKRFRIDHLGRSKALTEQKVFQETDGEFAVQSEVENKLLKSYHKYDFIAGSEENGKLIEVLKEDITFDYLFIETDLNSGKSILADRIKLERKDQFAFSFKRESTLYIVTNPRRSAKLIIYSKKYSEKLKADTIDFMQTSDSEQIQDIFFRSKFERILIYPDNIWAPINAFDYKHKAFINKNKFNIVLNDYNFTTYLISLDLNSLTYTISPHLPNPQSIKKDILSHTSTLIDSTLVLTYALKDKILLRFVNINTGQVLKEDILAADSLQKLNITIEKSGSKKLQKENLAESFEMLLKLLKESQLVVSEQKNGDHINLTVGASYFLHNNYFTEIVSAGIYEVKPDEKATSISFDIGYDRKTLEHNNSSPKKMMWEKMLMFLFAYRNYIGNIIFFHMNEHFYVGYYNYQVKKYLVHKFDDKLE